LRDWGLIVPSRACARSTGRVCSTAFFLHSTGGPATAISSTLFLPSTGKPAGWLCSSVILKAICAEVGMGPGPRQSQQQPVVALQLLPSFSRAQANQSARISPCIYYCALNKALAITVEITLICLASVVTATNWLLRRHGNSNVSHHHCVPLGNTPPLTTKLSHPL